MIVKTWLNCVTAKIIIVSMFSTVGHQIMSRHNDINKQTGVYYTSITWVKQSSFVPFKQVVWVNKIQAESLEVMPFQQVMHLYCMALVPLAHTLSGINKYRPWFERTPGTNLWNSVNGRLRGWAKPLTVREANAYRSIFIVMRNEIFEFEL